MTDQPKQDAIVSQRDRDLLEAITGGNFDFKTNAKRERLKMIATYRAEIEAATIERCAERMKAAVAYGYDQPEGADQCEHSKFRWDDCIACYDESLLSAVDDLRNLKGQTS